MGRTKKAIPVTAKEDSYNVYVKELEAKLLMYETKESQEEIVISQTDYIKVMSLLPYRLNLCTRERGQGKIYKFDTFGQIKKIIYSDLVDILEVCHDFLESGYFIILSPKVVRLHGFDEAYSKILTKEKIEEILNGTDEELALYSSANEKQQMVIVDLVIDKMLANPESVDLNMIDRLSRLSGVNISQKVEDTRFILKQESK
jgi:hypothetical protein